MLEKENSNIIEIGDHITEIGVDIAPGKLGIFFKIVNSGFETYKACHDYIIERDYKIVSKAILEKINFEDEKLNKKRENLIKKLNKKPDEFFKRFYNIVSSISIEEKGKYLVNLYANYLNFKISHEVFMISHYFLEKANIYDINMAMKLYKREHIEDSNGYYYIKQLVNYNLIDQRWGVLNGPSIEPNDYSLNEIGKETISAFLA